MPTAVPHRLFDRLVLALLVVIVAAPVTYLELTHPGWQQLCGQTGSIVSWLPGVSGAATTHTTAKSSPAKSQPAVSTAANPVATTTTSVTQSTTAKTATTNSYVHLRAGESVNSAILTDINAGVTVQLTSDADDTWQGVVYQGKTGYIYRAYLQY
jgi:cytoskeletal protein RodZ